MSDDLSASSQATLWLSVSQRGELALHPDGSIRTFEWGAAVALPAFTIAACDAPVAALCRLITGRCPSAVLSIPIVIS